MVLVVRVDCFWYPLTQIVLETAVKLLVLFSNFVFFFYVGTF